jgi:hypothetical protein
VIGVEAVAVPSTVPWLSPRFTSWQVKCIDDVTELVIPGENTEKRSASIAVRKEYVTIRGG